jgi:putative ABC transport system permease protein
MDTFVRDVRYAVRSLLRMRGVAVVAVLTLALGIGATTTMFSVVYAMLLRPPPFVEPHSLVILFNTSLTRRDGLQRLRWSMPNIADLERTATSFEHIGSFSGPLLTISGQGEPEHVEGETVSRGYFDALRVTPIAGRLFTAGESAPTGAQPVAIVSERLWQRKLAGDPTAVGRTMIVNDVPLTIVGILQDGFAGLSGKAQLWIPPPMAARLYYSEYLTTPQNFISVVARLKEGVTARQANAELAAIGSHFVGNGSSPDTVWGAMAVPLQEARVDPLLRQGRSCCSRRRRVCC